MLIVCRCLCCCLFFHVAYCCVSERGILALFYSLLDSNKAHAQAAQASPTQPQTATQPHVPTQIKTQVPAIEHKHCSAPITIMQTPPNHTSQRDTDIDTNTSTSSHRSRRDRSSSPKRDSSRATERDRDRDRDRDRSHDHDHEHPSNSPRDRDRDRSSRTMHDSNHHRRHRPPYPSFYRSH